MKTKARISILVAALLVAALLLSSCGKNINSYFDLFDKDMPYEGSVTYDSQYTALPELDGYVIETYTDENGETVELFNEEFAVFFKMTDSGLLSHKVLSFSAKQVVATFAAENTSFDFRLVEEAPAFRVKTTVIDPSIDILLGLDNVISIDYSLYDAVGNCVVTTDYSKMPYVVADYLLYDYAAYTYDANGIMAKSMDVPEYLMLEECFDWNDRYIYVADPYNGFTVYDREINSVCYWSAPGYEMDGCDMYVMNNDNVLVQYKVIMDEDNKDFDYVINNDDYKNLKIDLRTFIVDVETGEEKELKDFNYVIGGLITRASMVRGNDDPNAEDYFKFENLVVLLPIVDTRLDDSPRATDIVKMTDKGKLEESVKFVDFQTADIPARISEELYTVGLLSGQVAIIEEDGTVVHKLNKSYRIIDQYIIGEQAIYNFDMEKVYDIRGNDGSVIGIIGNTVYINVDTADGYDIIAFRGGNTNTVYSYNVNSTSGNVFDLITDADCYMIYNSASGEFTYYNCEDERITNSNEMLKLLAPSHTNSTYLMWNASALEPSYCLFSTTVGAAE